MFKEMLKSQIVFAKRVTRWEQDTVVNRRMAVDRYFGANGARARSEAIPNLAGAPLGAYNGWCPALPKSSS